MATKLIKSFTLHGKIYGGVTHLFQSRNIKDGPLLCARHWGNDLLMQVSGSQPRNPVGDPRFIGRSGYVTSDAIYDRLVLTKDQLHALPLDSDAQFVCDMADESPCSLI